LGNKPNQKLDYYYYIWKKCKTNAGLKMQKNQNQNLNLEVLIISCPCVANEQDPDTRDSRVYKNCLSRVIKCYCL